MNNAYYIGQVTLASNEALAVYQNAEEESDTEKLAFALTSVAEAVLAMIGRGAAESQPATAPEPPPDLGADYVRVMTERDAARTRIEDVERERDRLKSSLQSIANHNIAAHASTPIMFSVPVEPIRSEWHGTIAKARESFLQRAGVEG
jgi:hypothetical protein